MLGIWVSLSYIWVKFRMMWGQQGEWTRPVAFSPASQTMWTGMKRSVGLRKQTCGKEKLYHFSPKCWVFG